MSDREPMPNFGSNMAVVDQQPESDQFLADRSSSSSNASLLRTDARSSAASTDAAARAAPRRNWDRLTYGGFGGWFKRLFSSKKRAQHKREIQERRAAWSQLQEGMTDRNYVPNLSLLRSNWGGRKLRQLDADAARDAKAYRTMDQPAPDYLRAQQANIARMKYFLSNGDEDAQVAPAAQPNHRHAAELQNNHDAPGGPGATNHRHAAELQNDDDDVEDDVVVPGPSATRPKAEDLKSILKPEARPRPRLREHGPEVERALKEFDARYDEEHDASEHLKALKYPGEQTLRRANAKLTGAVQKNVMAEEDRQLLASGATWQDQGDDLRFPQDVALHSLYAGREKVNPEIPFEDQKQELAERQVRVRAEHKAKALAFHQGYWKREQKVPVKTSKATHDRRVQFNMGDSATEHLLNTPGNMPGEGEVMGRTEQGAPVEGRILPTGAFQYPAADPEKVYSGTSAAFRTDFNRNMVERPEHLLEHVLDGNSAFHSWAKRLYSIRNRPSGNEESRQAARLTPEVQSEHESRGAIFHRRRDEGIRPEDDLP